MKKTLALGTLLVLSACGGGSDNHDYFPPPAPQSPVSSNASFTIEAVNLTAGQPLSPLAVFIHDDSVEVFTPGAAASTELEVLAEAGDNSQLLAALAVPAKASGSAPIGPGASDSLSLELNGSDSSGMRLTIVSMLVNTNDAITAINSAAIETLAIGQSMTLNSIAYDTGTEANTETVLTIPGPAGGGEGFNSARDDIRDQVTMHGGVVSADDGLASSGLRQQHRWDNPVARFRITRTR